MKKNLSDEILIVHLVKKKLRAPNLGTKTYQTILKLTAVVQDGDIRRLIVV